MPADDPKKSTGWDALWDGPDGHGQAVADSAKGSAIDRFWLQFFGRELGKRDACDIADIACGAGVVTAAASVAAKKINAAGVRYWCVDISPAGARAAATRGAPAYAITADAAAAPFADRSFDIAASLFGVEYAGVSAFGEMARLVRPGGVMMAIAHRQDSPLAKECADNLALINVVIDHRLVDRARKAFAAGFALDRGAGDGAPFEAADRDLQAAVAPLREMLKSGPGAPAAAFLHQVHGDLGAMYQRRAAYDPDEVAQWLNNIDREATAYAERMRAMLAASLSREDVAAIVQMIESAGLKAAEPGAMMLGDHHQPSAWMISATR